MSDLIYFVSKSIEDVKSISGKDPRITWHHDPDFGREVPCLRPQIGAPSGAVGGWGECIARNYLVAQGIFVVRHAVLRLHDKRVVVDLLHPPSGTVYEVKCTRKPKFGIQMYTLRRLIQEGLANAVVYVYVRFDPNSNVPWYLRRFIEELGFDFLVLDPP